MKTIPSVMVSSTFYDLSQVREDIARFIIDEMGYECLLSEFPSFPIDPDLNTIENCRFRVEKNADILVLVIGGRYGSIEDSTNKSITNLEYITARNKGIPIYVFIEQKIISILPVWKKNRDADFSDVVDTERLFEFIENVISQDKVWYFAFHKANDIIKTLRIQFAYLFQESLGIRNKIKGKETPPYLKMLSAKAFRIALERPEAWEYKLFLQSWIDAVEQRSSMLKEHKERLKVDLTEYVSTDDVLEWIETRFHELTGLVDSCNRLMNESIQRAFGPNGQPGDVEEIVWVSEMIGNILETTLKWSKKIRCAHVDKLYEDLLNQLSMMADKIISQIYEIPRKWMIELEEALASRGKEIKTITFVLKFEASNYEAISKAIESIKKSQ